MKILFTGSSFTIGGELENPEEERFSRLVCNKLGAEEINVSRSGMSNDLILHNFLKFSTTCGKPDVAVIQWNHICIWQMWDDSINDWATLNIKNKCQLKLNAARYFRNVYTDQHGIENYWKNVYLTERYCKDNDIKLIMMNVKYEKPVVDYVSPYQSLCETGEIPFIKGGMLPYSNKMKPDELKEYWMEKLHPNIKGHQLIADHLIKLL